MGKKEKLAQRLHALLEAAAPAVIDPATAERLRAQLGPLSNKLWRDLLRDCGWPLSPLVEGVRQDDLTHLERTLLGLWQVYLAGSRQTQTLCRAMVIESKDHARLAARRLPDGDPKKALKQEMQLWMLTWLENPGAFELWVGLRKQRLAAIAAPALPPE